MEDCIFCKIIRREIPCDKVYEDEKVLAFRDINPEAPVHIIIIPKRHIASLNEVSKEDLELLSHILLVAKNIASENKIAETGYRLVNNCGTDGGQTVPHLHFHILGGRSLGWPPG
ncbi:MAG: histidine triad nucleotide-binding protein [Clostridiaceae bacterium]|nr:histidine triad nucleotide-binding protein [Clostridiaceae bacterium]